MFAKLLGVTHSVLVLEMGQVNNIVNLICHQYSLCEHHPSILWKDPTARNYPTATDTLCPRVQLYININYIVLEFHLSLLHLPNSFYDFRYEEMASCQHSLAIDAIEALGVASIDRTRSSL
jgi:hypothetical protein